MRRYTKTHRELGNKSVRDYLGEGITDILIQYFADECPRCQYPLEIPETDMRNAILDFLQTEDVVMRIREAHQAGNIIYDALKLEEL